MSLAFVLAEWCSYAVGAILAGNLWGHLSAWWLLAAIPLGFLSGFLRGVATAQERKQRGSP